MANLTLTISEALSRAFSAYNAGKLVEAEQLCQQIIEAEPDLFEALHLLAVVQSRLGEKDTALASYERALAVRPDYAEALSNRGLTLHELKRFEEALASYDRALTMRPDFADALKNFSDTAALISNLDLVISVDTSVAHLAGAPAKRVWVLLPFVPDWRWLLDRNDSPWYPTAWLFQQDETRTWDNVIARVHAALYDFVQYRS
jgi:tetratricopeptide (TPR) repeat protein